MTNMGAQPPKDKVNHRSDNKKINMQKRTHVLIIEAYTDANIGSCALVENSIKILEEKFENPEIKVMAHAPEPFRDLYGKEAIKDVFHYPFKQSIIKKWIWLIKTFGWMLGSVIVGKALKNRKISPKGWYPFQEKIRPFLWADLVVSVGAERINDKFYKDMVFSLFNLYLVKALGKRMVIFPATIGPFLFWWSKRLAAVVLKYLDIIYVRDKRSYTNATELLKVPKEKVIYSPDVAVLQSSIDKKAALRMIDPENEDRLVGISTMRWGYYKNRVTPYSNYESYVKEMATTADSIINDYGVKVIFYPTNFLTHGCKDDDLVTAYDILALMNNKDKVKITDKLCPPSKLQGLLSCSQVNITTRMHACILSTNSFVPTISVNYLFKLKEYMGSLGLSEFSIDIEDFCAERALSAFNKIWPERSKWRGQIEMAINQKRDQLWKSMEAIDAIF